MTNEEKPKESSPKQVETPKTDVPKMPPDRVERSGDPFIKR